MLLRLAASREPAHCTVRPSVMARLQGQSSAAVAAAGSAPPDPLLTTVS